LKNLKNEYETKNDILVAISKNMNINTINIKYNLAIKQKKEYINFYLNNKNIKYTSKIFF
jgi:hypothetical protein